MSDGLAILTAANAAGGGSGTVTSVSVTTANGVAGSVATATTTPAITITLGAITPSSVAASGTVTGSNLSGTHSGTSSGTNTGDQTITLTGNVTGSGTGSFATTIAASAVTNAMLAGSIASSKLVGSDIATVGTITSGTWSGTMTIAGLSAVVSTCYITGTVAQATNPAAWGDVTGLSFSLASGATYAFEFELATVASATTNFGLYGVNGPTNSLLVVNVSRAGNTAGTGGCFSSTTAYDTGTPPASVNSSGALPVRISGIITTTASGTLIVRQKNTTNGAAVTVNAGSWGRLTRLA